MYIFRRFSEILLLFSLLLFGAFLFKNRGAVDIKAPVITIDEKLVEISVRDSEDKLLEGVTAKDSKDGDVTDTLFVESISNFYSNGKRLVTFVAFDSDNHLSRASRELCYTDYTSPEFIISEPFQFFTGSINLKISATDCLDGDITSAIKMNAAEPITTSQPGEYEAVFQVSNSAGDVSTLPVVIEIMDPNRQYIPRITLKEYVAYLNKGEAFDPGRYMQTVILGNREYEVIDDPAAGQSEETGEDNRISNTELTIDKSLIIVSGAENVNINEPGTYRVKYSVTLKLSNNERVTGHTYQYVVVR